MDSDRGYFKINGRAARGLASVLNSSDRTQPLRTGVSARVEPTVSRTPFRRTYGRIEHRPFEIRSADIFLALETKRIIKEHDIFGGEWLGRK